MNKKSIFVRGVLSLSFIALLVLPLLLTPSKALSEGFGHPASGESAHKSKEKEDPHARFRDGSFEGMMGSMAKSPHSKSAKKSVHSPFSARGLKESLGLDDDQAKKIKSVLSEYKKGVIMKKAKLRVAQIELDEMVADRDFVLADVKKKVKARESAATKLTMVRVEALVGAKTVLSEAQFEQFMGMLAHHMSGRGHAKKGKRSHGVHGGSGIHSRRSGKHHGESSSTHGGFSTHGKSGSRNDYDD